MPNKNPPDHNLQRPVSERYDEIGEWFEQARRECTLERPYLEKLVSLLPEKARLLDMGCGSGVPIGAFFLDKGFHVTGVDGSEKLLSYAKEQFPQARWIHSDLGSFSINETFDVIIAWGVVFHFNLGAQERLFEIFSKHLKPDGLMLFTTGDQRNENAHWSEMDGVSFPHFSFDPAEYKALLEKNDFTQRELNLRDPLCGGQTVWLAKKNEKNSVV